MYEFIHGPCPHFSETSGVSTLLDNFHKQDRTLIYQLCQGFMTLSLLMTTWPQKLSSFRMGPFERTNQKLNNLGWRFSREQAQNKII